ncbi:MAG: hypothetical protein JWN18_101 [Parcubacteria group bacterium]|nr:hypothetical protein [Parcubacteria group bacterium]
MKVEVTLRLLKLIKMYILDTEEKFTTGSHFADKNGRPLEASVSAIPKVARRCIGGAVIEGLVALGIDNNASPESHGYKIAMYNLGDSLGSFQSGEEKIRAVMRMNNEEGFKATHSMLDKAIKQCEAIVTKTKTRR